MSLCQVFQKLSGKADNNFCHQPPERDPCRLHICPAAYTITTKLPLGQNSAGRLDLSNNCRRQPRLNLSSCNHMWPQAYRFLTNISNAVGSDQPHLMQQPSLLKVGTHHNCSWLGWFQNNINNSDSNSTSKFRILIQHQLSVSVLDRLFLPPLPVHYSNSQSSPSLFVYLNNIWWQNIFIHWLDFYLIS